MADFTKKALAESLKTLMKEKSLDKITVKELTLHCGVNRQTFYYHFTDIFDLIKWIYKVEAVEAIKNYKSYNTWQQGFLKIFNYIKENLFFFKNCLSSSGREYLDRFLFDSTFSFLIGVVKEVAIGKNLPDKELNFIASFYTYAFIGIVINWIREGAKEDPEEIINDINRLVEGDIKKAITGYI